MYMYVYMFIYIYIYIYIYTHHCLVNLTPSKTTRICKVGIVIWHQGSVEALWLQIRNR